MTLKVTCRLTALHRDQLQAQHSVTSMGEPYLYLGVLLAKKIAAFRRLYFVTLSSISVDCSQCTADIYIIIIIIFKPSVSMIPRDLETKNYHHQHHIRYYY